jgi:CRP-like cAMP-binding protein
VRVEDVARLVHEAPLFGDLDDVCLEALARYGDIATFPDGALLGRQGTPADRFFVILGGGVALEAREPGCPPTPIDSLGPGEVVGWSWLSAPYRWHFDVRASGPVRAVAIEAEALRVAMTGDDHLASQLLRRFTAVLIRRLQATRHRMLTAGPSSWYDSGGTSCAEIPQGASGVTPTRPPPRRP